MTAPSQEGKQAKTLPSPNSGFYELAETLGAEEHGLLRQLRTFLDSRVAPIINKYWAEDSFPFELLPAFGELGIGGLGDMSVGGSALLEGLAAMQLARVDASLATFCGVHNGLAMGSIYEAGSEEQKRKWLPARSTRRHRGRFRRVCPRHSILEET